MRGKERASRLALVEQGIVHAERLRSGAIPASALTVLAAERSLRDLVEADAGRGLWELRGDLAEAPMLLAGLLPIIKGPMAGQPLVLMGW